MSEKEDPGTSKESSDAASAKRPTRGRRVARTLVFDGQESPSVELAGLVNPTANRKVARTMLETDVQFAQSLSPEVRRGGPAESTEQSVTPQSEPSQSVSPSPEPSQSGHSDAASVTNSNRKVAKTILEQDVQFADSLLSEGSPGGPTHSSEQSVPPAVEQSQTPPAAAVPPAAPKSNRRVSKTKLETDVQFVEKLSTDDAPQAPPPDTTIALPLRRFHRLQILRRTSRSAVHHSYLWRKHCWTTASFSRQERSLGCGKNSA